MNEERIQVILTLTKSFMTQGQEVATKNKRTKRFLKFFICTLQWRREIRQLMLKQT